MAPSPFEIIEHTVECQHIREYARATASSQEQVLRLAVKQYIPVDNQQPQEGDVTIIGTHGNGFPKELYEPLWEDIYLRAKDCGFRIRSIWIADVAHEGFSGILNENTLGNDPSWVDHSRDLLQMINKFRAEMPMPLVGIGHSFGASALCNLAVIHPRLFSTLVLLEPTLETFGHRSGLMEKAVDPLRMSALRRDFWPSRAKAEAAFRKSAFYRGWDSRVLDRWCEYGIRETPSALYPNERGSVTLTTSKHQECFTFARPSWEGVTEDGKTIINRELIPDLDLTGSEKHPFYRSEPASIFKRLGELRPSVLFVFGENSPWCFPQARETLVNVAGADIGGSGGVKNGKVNAHVVKGSGHMVVFDATKECADTAASWLGREVKRIEKERAQYLEWTKQSLEAKSTLSADWKKWLGISSPRSKI